MTRHFIENVFYIWLSLNLLFILLSGSWAWITVDCLESWHLWSVSFLSEWSQYVLVLTGPKYLVVSVSWSKSSFPFISLGVFPLRAPVFQPFLLVVMVDAHRYSLCFPCFIKKLLNKEPDLREPWGNQVSAPFQRTPSVEEGGLVPWSPSKRASRAWEHQKLIIQAQITHPLGFSSIGLSIVAWMGNGPHRSLSVLS